jgi:hypothetical protein
MSTSNGVLPINRSKGTLSYLSTEGTEDGSQLSTCARPSAAVEAIENASRVIIDMMWKKPLTVAKEQS